MVYADTVEKALCFGWIDSRPNTLDAERYAQFFTPRQVKSPWSRLNKERVERLIARGLMAPAGLAAIEAARQAGTWDSYDEIEDLRIPPDLQEAFAQNVEASGISPPSAPPHKNSCSGGLPARNAQRHAPDAWGNWLQRRLKIATPLRIDANQNASW